MTSQRSSKLTGGAGTTLLDVVSAVRDTLSSARRFQRLVYTGGPGGIAPFDEVLTPLLKVREDALTRAAAASTGLRIALPALLEEQRHNGSNWRHEDARALCRRVWQPLVSRSLLRLMCPRSHVHGPRGRSDV